MSSSKNNDQEKEEKSPRSHRMPSLRESLLSRLAQDYVKSFQVARPEDLKPFVGAQPKVIREPRIFSQAESQARTAIACSKVKQSILNASSVLLVLAQDASYSPVCRSLLTLAKDNGPDSSDTDDNDVIALGTDWIHCIPYSEAIIATPKRTANQLLICVGTTSKYSNMCLGDPTMTTLDEAYDSCNLICLTRSALMLPLGNQEQNIFGAHADQVMESIQEALLERGQTRGKPPCWGHDQAKHKVLSWAYMHLPVAVRLHHNAQVHHMPEPLKVDESAHNIIHINEQDTIFDHLADYIRFQNLTKLAMGPGLRVWNFYDSGLNVSVTQKYALQQGISLLMNRDGLAMNRDASIGHVLSKLNQLTTVDPWRSMRGIYNFFVGDGASRLNGGAELAFYLMERFHSTSSEESAQSFTTLFVFVNEMWAIEDNLISKHIEEHKLYNRNYYELLSEHPNVTLCKGPEELHEKVCSLSKQQREYVRSEEDQARGRLNVVFICDIDFPMPPAIFPEGETESSPEVLFLKSVLEGFAKGCELPIPLYGCSAYEYLQYLNAFMKTPVGSQKYQYITGMTDIQAAHLCGFDHVENKSVLFINDIFGIHSLGESLRMNQSGLGGDGYNRQLIIFVWHPSLNSTQDHFQPHRPPMIWPSVSTLLAKFYVLKESDAAFFDFDGGTDKLVKDIKTAIDAKASFILINMLPEQERNFIQLDIRLKM